MKYGGVRFIRLLELCVFEVLISMISADTRICVDRGNRICILAHIWTVESKSLAQDTCKKRMVKASVFCLSSYS